LRAGDGVPHSRPPSVAVPAAGPAFASWHGGWPPKITQIYEGTNQMNRMVMARNLLK
jgi:hypothetical protein